MRRRRVIWFSLLAVMVLLPSLTWLEHFEGTVAGIELNGRFGLWAGAAAFFAISAALWFRPRRRVAIVLAGLAWIAWLSVAAVIAGQPPREWLPTILRWTLYVAAAAVAFDHVRAYGYGARSQYQIAAAALLVVPIAAGLAEAALGTAPVLNNAPRITATMPQHPVAFSLVLGTGLLLTVPAWSAAAGRHRLALLCLLLLAYVAILLTFTRATMWLIPLAALAVVALSVSWRQQWRTLLGAGLVACLALAISIPFTAARIGDAPPMPVRLPDSESPSRQPSIEPSPGSSRDETPSASPSPGVVPIDNSMGLRLETHLRALRYIRESPVVGHGPGSFDRLFEEDTGDPNVAAHNDLLQVAVETGIVGSVLLGILFLLVVAMLSRHVKRSRGIDRWLASAVAVSFVAVNVVGTIHNPFYFPEVQLPLWVGVGVVLGRPLPEPTG